MFTSDYDIAAVRRHRFAVTPDGCAFRLAHSPVFGFGTDARRIASRDKRGYIGSKLEGKTEIPNIPWRRPPRN
jgi:hypothetical protein